MGDPYIEMAAHVGHGIEHTSSRYEVGLTWVGIGIGVAICVATFAATGPGAIACVGGIIKWRNRGKKLGELIDDFLGEKVVEERLGGGLASVRLGPEVEPAARAFPDSHPREQHQTQYVAEGSEIVFLGAEICPMGRRRDRTTCGGQLVEGLGSVVVGGRPSAEGMEIDELPSDAKNTLNLVSRALDAANSLATGGLRGLAVSEAKRQVREHGGGVFVDAADLWQAGRPRSTDSLASSWKQLRAARRMGGDALDLARRLYGG